jgi:predicted  nucleic acid-binding Zn-ribbon protein
MTEALSVTLASLTRLGRLDAKILKHTAEKKRLLALEGDVEKVIGSIKLELTELERKLSEKKGTCEKEEKFLATERQKLVDRRKSLSSLGDYKLQAAAEREIEHSSRQLSKQEEHMLQHQTELESLAKLRDEKAKYLEEKSGAAERLLAEALDKVSVIDSELGELNAKRQSEASSIERPQLMVYQRAFTRNPNDPVISLKGSACGGCFCNLGPQILGQVMVARELVTCRSCGRILTAPEAEAEAS